MLKITDDMTIVQLSIELAKRGVEYVSQEIKCGAPRPFMVTIGRLTPSPLECTGTGTGLAEAYDDAFARFTHRVAQRDLASQMDRN